MSDYSDRDGRCGVVLIGVWMPKGSEQLDLLDCSASEKLAADMDADDVGALLRSARAGSSQAFEQFAKLYLGRLYAFARRLTGDAHLAEDVVQEALIRAYRKAPTSGVNLGQWLFVVTRNAALNLMRSRSRQRTQALAAGPEPVAARQADSVEAGERSCLVQAALMTLPEDQRAAIVLAKYHGYTCGRIAEILSCSVSAVKMRISRGMRQLRTALAELEEPGGT